MHFFTDPSSGAFMAVPWIDTRSQRCDTIFLDPSIIAQRVATVETQQRAKQQAERERKSLTCAKTEAFMEQRRQHKELRIHCARK